MEPAKLRERKLTVEGAEVSALHLAPARPAGLYVLAHGAGAGMRHPFLEEVATRLAAVGIATLRYQFPFVERGGRRPDSPRVAQAAVRAAVQAARADAPSGLVLVAGGKSFGGRMTSEAQAAEPLEGVRGLVFLGFPLHAAGRPDVQRAAHLDRVEVPMLFVQGTRDALASLERLRPVVQRLGPRARLHVVAGGDHSFRVPKRSGRDPGQVVTELAGAIRDFVIALAGASS